jgi:hypothetical protein
MADDDKDEQEQDRNFAASDLLLTAIAVIPGEHQHDRQAYEKHDNRELPHLLGPMKGLADILEALQESPCARDVHQAPLHDLPVAQTAPGAPTLYRRFAHLACPRAAV